MKVSNGIYFLESCWMSKPLNVHLSTNDMDNMADNMIAEPCGTGSLSSDHNDSKLSIYTVDCIPSVENSDEISFCSFL